MKSITNIEIQQSVENEKYQAEASMKKRRRVLIE